MTPIATLLWATGVIVLFVLDRNRKERTSPALWLPIAWLSIIGSRAVSQWLQLDTVGTASQYLEGSPLDRDVYAVMVLLGIIVLLGRTKAVWRLLRGNAPIFIFLAYCAISIVWSDFPDVAFKRWIKFLGDHVMVLIVLTDPNWKWAVKKVFARVGFLLLPASVLFIKYYPDLGRSYGRWEGKQSYTGVALDKNMLGMACLIFGLPALWRVLQEIRERRISFRNRPLVAQTILLAAALWLLWMANSMTSSSCFLFAACVIAATTFGKIGRRPARVHWLVGGVVLTSFSVLFLNLGSFVLAAVGRDSTLTGRTDIWASVLALATHRWVGTGFESFWLGPRLETIWKQYWFHPIEAHNGYLETYLNLGWVGIGLLAVLMVTGYRNVIRMLKWDPESARIRLGFIVVGLTYNFTEAAVHTQCLVWLAFLLAAMKLPQPKPAKLQKAQPSAEPVGLEESNLASLDPAHTF
ncbi:MAG TPA: O-antigen ligase family protein [Candidatus Sulfotelmatobacter sp.]|jgi:exopolysaccharide production protein ExoQ